MKGVLTMPTRLTDEASIEKILSEMTPEEKMRLLTGSTTFRGGGNEKYGIPRPVFLDGGTGFNTHQMTLDNHLLAMEEAWGEIDPEICDTPMGGFGIALDCTPHPNRPVDADASDLSKREAELMEKYKPADGAVGCYPPGILLGATMDPKVVHDCAEALGREASACGIDVLLGTPNVNIQRDPRGGRGFEGYSEDPYLAASLAPEFVKGVEESGVLADVKHFAANNLETDRMGVDETISERALREIYLPGFEACVKAGCSTVMTAYNSINGTPCAQNEWLLKKVLRGEWGFDGFTMSDWGAVYDRVKGQNAGNDVCMPGPRAVGDMLAAYEDGKLTDETLNDACRRYLRAILRMPIVRGRKYTRIDPEHSMAAAYEAAVSGMVLLKNERGLLPLAPGTGVAFYGPRSKAFTFCGAGSAEVETPIRTSMFDTAVGYSGAEKISYEQILPSTECVVVTVGANGQEGTDRPDMCIEAEDRPLLKRAIREAKEAGKPVVLVLNVAAPVLMEEVLEDVDAVLCVWLPGMAGGKAAADLLFGARSPSGKLPLTFPKAVTDCPAYGNFPGYNAKVNYGEGIYVGYRWYATRRIEPRFPFGFGLTYSEFEIDRCQAPAEADMEQDLTVRCVLKNVGCVPAAETVQLYLEPTTSLQDRPLRELKGFRKVFLRPGEAQELCFTLTKRSFACYDEKLSDWVTEPGTYRICLGTSSENIAAVLPVKLIGVDPYCLKETSGVARVAGSPDALAVLRELMPQLDIPAVLEEDVTFLPRRPFGEVWTSKFLPRLNGTDEEKSLLYAELLRRFQTIR